MKNNNSFKNHNSVLIENLKVYFPVRRGVFNAVVGNVKAVDDISLNIKQGEIFALVGESGCGKSTTAQAVLGLTAVTSGKVSLAVGDWKENPVQWQNLHAEQKRKLRKSIQAVFQDPYSSLNPRMTVQMILEEPFIIHQKMSKSERIDNIISLLGKVGLSADYLSRYPHEFSGGQRQRIGIARALATNPELIIADEPVSALDVSIQAQIINLLQDLQSSGHQTLLFISHDLALVHHVASRLAVMYLGKIVESGTESQIFTSPKHPYTQLLLDSVPVPGKGRTKKGLKVGDDKEVPIPVNGCSFYPRCPRRKEECKISTPILHIGPDEHSVACFNPIS
ncbi:MAG: ABC transporter ATP-binding protein [Fibrobacter sp.]|nr:ABC transporter ATP-binding protein [Fibrobacter sp.]